MGAGILDGVSDVDLGVLDELTDTANDIVDQNIVNAQVNLNALLKIVPIFLVIHVMSKAVLDTLIVVGDIHPDGFRKLAGLVVVLKNLYHLGKVLLCLIVSILISLEMTINADFEARYIGNHMDGSTASYCNRPFHFCARFDSVSVAKVKAYCPKLWYNIEKDEECPYLRIMAEYYRHFKGKVYRLVSIAKASETLEKIVVYQAMYDNGDIWVRPFEDFFGKVVRDGIVQDRFSPIDENEALEQAPIYLNPKYCFPDINYQAATPSMLNPEAGFSRGVKAMVSLLLRRGLVSKSFFEGLFNDDDIEKEAIRQIRAYQPGGDLESIFHLIQSWGGNSGRGIYLHGNSFNWDDLKPKYQTLINACLITTEINDESIAELVKAVKSFDKSVDHLGVSFITKHVRFWLFRTLDNNALPIYDSIMANEVMRLNDVNVKHLAEYWKVMAAKAKQLGIGLVPLERQIFQYSLGTR